MNINILIYYKYENNTYNIKYIFHFKTYFITDCREYKNMITNFRSEIFNLNFTQITSFWIVLNNTNNDVVNNIEINNGNDQIPFQNQIEVAEENELNEINNVGQEFIENVAQQVEQRIIKRRRNADTILIAENIEGLHDRKRMRKF